MAAALMALSQASLLQQGKTQHEKTFPQSHNWGNTADAFAAPGPAAVKPGALLSTTKVGGAGEILRQLVVAAQELSNAERMLEDAQQAVRAGDEEAQKWYQVAITTMQWTRQAQTERVQTLLKTLKSSALAQQDTPAPVGPPAGIALSADSRTLVPPLEPAALTPETSKSDELAAPACSEEVAVAAARSEEKANIGSLRSDLERIKDKDPKCCLTVRHIKALGLESGELLREHFSRLADVEEVHVAHSFEKPTSKRRHGRVRPAALGFVVMASREAAERVLAVGSEQLVGDARINVRLIEPFD